MEKAMIGMSQQKKAIIKQRLTSSVSIFLISPYFTTRTVPRAAMPTTTIDQPMISHLKKSGKQRTSILNDQWSISNYQFKNLPIDHSLIIGHRLISEVKLS
jgi:hypothetical protein